MCRSTKNRPQITWIPIDRPASLQRILLIKKMPFLCSIYEKTDPFPYLSVYPRTNPALNPSSHLFFRDPTFLMSGPGLPNHECSSITPYYSKPASGLNLVTSWHTIWAANLLEVLSTLPLLLCSVQHTSSGINVLSESVLCWLCADTRGGGNSAVFQPWLIQPSLVKLR